MYKIAVVGDSDSIYGFASVGFDTYPARTESDALHKVKEIWSDYAIIYVTESCYEALTEEIDKKLTPLPVITPIPGVKNNTGIGVANVKKAVEVAVGSDIIFGNKE
ncbi:MAG: V-type ATP synthase subunit F [Lachnospiraceae bacterium]|nr:V-type ATP synthase subunit F [Lachnospiraceae bacterium]